MASMNSKQLETQWKLTRKKQEWVRRRRQSQAPQRGRLVLERQYCDIRISNQEEQTVIFGPPRKVPPSNNMLKDKTNEAPGDIIDSSSRGN